MSRQSNKCSVCGKYLDIAKDAIHRDAQGVAFCDRCVPVECETCGKDLPKDIDRFRCGECDTNAVFCKDHIDDHVCSHAIPRHLPNPLTNTVGVPYKFENPRPFKIPESVQIMGRTYEVLYDKEVIKNHPGLQAVIMYRKQTIHILPLESDASERTQEAIEVDFLHELTHAILHALAYNQLDEDEQFVGSFSEMLYQVLRQIT